jgi:hypothetical protein
MGGMLANGRSIHQCSFGCCGDMVSHGKRGAQRWHRILRSRENRQWRDDARQFLSETEDVR